MSGGLPCPAPQTVIGSPAITPTDRMPNSYAPTMRGRSNRAVVFYGGISLLLVAIALKLHESVLPTGLAVKVGHNSEALLFALLVAAGVEWRSGRSDVARAARFLVPAAAGCLVAGALLWGSSLPTSVVTLNEPLIGVGLVLLYAALPRPVRGAVWVTVAVLVVIVLAFDTTLVRDQAEGLVPFALAPIALDVIDRSVLDPAQPERRRLVAAWMATLLVVAIGFILLAPWARAEPGGFVPAAIDYGQRSAEAYWGWLLLHGYFWIRPVRARLRAENRPQHRARVGSTR